MRKLALAVLVVVCGLGFIGSVYAAALEKGETVYTRSNLRLDGNTIFWHNMSALRGRLPVGTEAKIEKCTGGSIVFVTNDTNKSYRIAANSGKWNKFLVKDKKEIGLDGISSDKRSQIENGEAAAGMTKEAVYASRGCPAYIAWGKTSERKTFDDIMKSDTWYYMANSRGHSTMVTFADGIVAKTGGFEK